MADFRKMIPFICRFAAGVSGKDLELPYPQLFERARKTGWSDDPDDPGGATMVDVTIGTYRQYCRRKGKQTPTKQCLRNITYTEWEEILKTMYWDVCKGDEIESQGVANLIVDWIWASGPGKLKVLQRILGVTADGIVGRKTLAAINGSVPEDLFEKIRTRRETDYRLCRGAWKYLRGWLRRLAAIRPDGGFEF